MWESIKNNALLKTIVVVILGVLGFGLAFNIMFGRNTGMMGEGMVGGYSLDSTLAYILIILVKLLVIALVLIALAAVYKYGRKYLFEGGEINLFGSVKNDPVLKAASIIIASVLVIALIAMLFGNIFGGFAAVPNYNYYAAASGGLGITSLLMFLFKLLLVISGIGLVASVVLYIIQNPVGFGSTKSTCTTTKTEPNCACSKCGTVLKHDWKCCPNCGEDKELCEMSNAAPIIDAVDTEEENHIETAVSEKATEAEVKEDIKENIASNENIDVYEKLYSSTQEEAIDNTKPIKNKKKQNKR